MKISTSCSVLRVCTHRKLLEIVLSRFSLIISLSLFLHIGRLDLRRQYDLNSFQGTLIGLAPTSETILRHLLQGEKRLSPSCLLWLSFSVRRNACTDWSIPMDQLSYNIEKV